jgi:hypothetical protein
VSALLEVTKAEVDDFTVGSNASAAAAAELARSVLQLPTPWVAGSEMVRVIGVVAQRRR